MMKRIFLCIIIMLFCFIILCVGNEVHAAAIPEGTTIYYDDSVTNWGSVNMYFFKKSGTDSGWYNDIFMVPVPGESGIFSYTLTNNSAGYDWIIFRNSARDSQTADLEYIKPNYIFKSENIDAGQYKGSWYIKDTSGLIAKKNNFATLKKEWYTSASYAALEGVVSSIPTMNSSYLKSYLEGGKYISNYEKDLTALNIAYDNLELSPEKLSNKIKELEMKNMGGYTIASIIEFRNEISNVKKYIADGIYTEASLEGKYNLLEEAYNSLEITTEAEENEAIEALKTEIDKLKGLINTNSTDIQEILKVCSGIEALYENLTNQNSNLLQTVSKLLEESNKNASADNATLAIYISTEMEKLNALLYSDDIKMEELISQYKEIEENYKKLLENTSEIEKLLENNKRIEELILGLDKKISENKEDKKDNKPMYIALGTIGLEGIVIAGLMLRKKK